MENKIYLNRRENMASFFVWVIGILLILQIMLLTGLAGWKTVMIRNEGKINAEISKLQPQYKEYVAGSLISHPDAPAKNRFQAATVERLLESLVHTDATTQYGKRITELAHRHLSERYRIVLQKGTWAERINCLYFIEDFKMEELKDELYVHYKSLHKRDEEYRQCLRAAAVLGEGRISGAFFAEPPLSIGFIKELLVRMDAEMLSDLAEHIETRKEVPQNLLFAFITFNGEQKNQAFFPFVEQMIHDERKEVRIKAMKSLCDYEKMSNPSMLAGFFKSVFWEERMYAAKLAGACKLDEYKKPMAQLFSDPVWWVRFAAADNINGLEGGPLLLKDIAATSNDAYARDIAKHMLTRKGRVAS